MNLQQDRIDLARETAFSLGAIFVQPSAREIRIGDEREILEPRIMQVLVALARRRGEVVSRDELIALCWAGRVVGDDAINRCIARIRRLSETYGGFALETIARVGYRLTVDNFEPIPPTAEQTPASRNTWQPRHYAFAGLALLLVIAGCLVYWLLQRQPDKIVVVHPPAKLTIAVLPFTPLYGGSEAQKLGDAIASSMADALTSSAFDVISPGKSLSFRGAAKAGAAQALHADFLVDGDLRRNGDEIVVAVRIIEGSTGLVAGAGTIERPVAEAADLPSELAVQVAALGMASRGFSHANGWDPRVMAAYIRASYQSAAQDDAYAANETARAAVKLAPNDPFAQTLHGFMAANLVRALPTDRRAAMVVEAREAANRAIQLDPSSGEPYAVLSLITPLFEWAAREQQLRHGLAIFPDSQNASIQLIELLQNSGRFAESAPLSEALFKTNAFQTHKLIDLINSKLWTDQIATARNLIAQGRELYPRTAWFTAKMFEATAFHGALGEADLLLQDKTVKSVMEADGSLKVFADIAAALRLRRPSDVAAVVQDCAQPQGRTAEVKRTCFMALVVLGRQDDAFRLAALLYPDQRGATAQARERPWLSSDMSPAAYLSIPITAPLRRDPRYRDVVERLGLLQYWKTSGHPPDFCASEKVPVCRLLSR